MDALDQAQAREDALLERRISAIREASGSGEVPAGAARDCAGCAAPIPAKRLRALPAAKLCIDCQSQQEAEG